jgi:hypothetical protein
MKAARFKGIYRKGCEEALIKKWLNEEFLVI